MMIFVVSGMNSRRALRMQASVLVSTAEVESSKMRTFGFLSLSLIHIFGLGADVTNLGAVKEPGLEALIASEPDLILASCNTAANLELLDTFEAAGLCVAYFDVQTLDDYLNMLGICTTLTGCEENYELNGSAVRAQADAAIARQTGEAPTVLCIRATGVSCKVKGSRDFVLGEMLADLG